MDTEPVFHDAFYRFVSITDVDDTAAVLRELTTALTGVLLVASEGLNGTLAGTAAALDAFHGALATDPRLASRLRGILVKRTACLTPPFQRMKVHSRPEILPLGVAGVNAVGHVGQQVAPAQWRALLDDPNVVVIDNRNHFEVRLGRFRNAVDPQVHNFRDFPAYIESQLPIWQAEGKQVAMYCTGGIRCEKTSAWLHERGVPVLQLEGGILNYFAQVPDAERDWRGECFVFDNRIALDTRLRETGITAEAVYAGGPDEAWRLQRAQRLAGPSSARDAESSTPDTAGPAP